MATKSLIFTCSLLLYFSSCPAQNAVLLEYDYLKGEISRLSYITKKNDTLNTNSTVIKIKAAVPLQVKIKNFNIEALKAHTTIENRKKEVTSSSGSLTGFVKSLSNLLSPAMGIDLTTIIRDRGSASESLKQFAAFYPDFSAIDYTTDENAVLKYDQLIRERLTTVSEWRGVANGLKKLRYDTRKTKSETLSQATQLISSLDPSAAEFFGNPLNVDQFAGSIAAENFAYLQMIIKEYGKEIKELNLQSQNSKVAEMVLSNYKTYEVQVNETLDENIHDILQSIGRDYQTLVKNPYESTLTMTLEEEASTLKIEILERETDSISVEPVLTKIISVRGPVGLGLSNSIGMNFVRFASPEMDYYLSDKAEIIETPGNAVLPTLSVLINFFRPSEKPTKVGGHFAVGIPLSEDKNIHYLIGPSIILGRGSPVILNLGVNIGKANRLGRGLKAGDTFHSSDTIPIISRYSFGYQFGISFNMSELLSK